ncbi:hypothetical protein [Nocardia cyriacigeorgica]|nr:hypothetical protein [Nocardia cyriacigeorgica]
MIESTLGNIAPQGPVKADLFEFATAILEQGKTDGSLRPDVTSDDLYMIIGSLAAVVRADLGDWQRFIDIILDGLKP